MQFILSGNLTIEAKNEDELVKWLDNNSPLSDYEWQPYEFNTPADIVVGKESKLSIALNDINRRLDLIHNDPTRIVSEIKKEIKQIINDQ